MLHQLTRYFKPSPATHQAYALYAHINEASRRPHFFESWGVPDTIDGRFEMIVLHMFIYLHSLKQKEMDSTELQRTLIEAFFEDMDRSVREMGVGDTGVSKRIKKMANAFYGRIHAYDTALDDTSALDAAIIKNVFGTLDEPPQDVSEMRDHLHASLADLATKEIASPDFLAASG